MEDQPRAGGDPVKGQEGSLLLAKVRSAMGA